MQHYSRRTRIHDAADLQTGDLIDISSTAMPSWARVEGIGHCTDDEDADDNNCPGDGSCDAVIFFADEDATAALHVTAFDLIYGRLLAEVTDTDIEAANDAHAAAAAARFTPTI